MECIMFLLVDYKLKSFVRTQTWNFERFTDCLYDCKDTSAHHTQSNTITSVFQYSLFWLAAIVLKTNHSETLRNEASLKFKVELDTLRQAVLSSLESHATCRR